jgi:5'-3' exonuclease
VLGSVLSLIEGGGTHVGVATDHVIESFRNDLYSGYKTSEGVDPALLSQFPILEEALQSIGVRVWPMIEFEADDALASAAAKAAQDDRVRQVIPFLPERQYPIKLEVLSSLPDGVNLNPYFFDPA